MILDCLFDSQSDIVCSTTEDNSGSVNMLRNSLSRTVASCFCSDKGVAVIKYFIHKIFNAISIFIKKKKKCVELCEHNSSGFKQITYFQ